ncbi:hypothetical protein HR12_15950 [Microbacterium sp. SUBG005]|nr:hypothetical protein HR12_15950 [Microbacterium sp. SUBG005]
MYLHHKGPHTVGDVLYKGALQGESARSVWIGDVLIGPDATGTDSYEANRNLVLTDGARATRSRTSRSRPVTSRARSRERHRGVDDEQLFYLQARGIAEDEARRRGRARASSARSCSASASPSSTTELIEAIERELAEGAAA